MSWEPWYGPDEPEPKRSPTKDRWYDHLYIGEEVISFDGNTFRSSDLKEYVSDMMLNQEDLVRAILIDYIHDHSDSYDLQE